MKLDDLREVIRQAKGGRVTIYTRQIFGDGLSSMKATVCGKIYQRGWWSPGGGWCSQRLGGDRPAWWLPVREYRKRKPAGISVEGMVKVEPGWTPKEEA